MKTRFKFGGGRIDGRVNVVRKRSEAESLLDRIWRESKDGKPASVDTEFGRDERTNQEYITVWSVSTGKGDLNCLYADPTISVFKDWLEDERAPKVFQNYVADEDSFLASEKIQVRGLHADTMVMSAIVDTADVNHDLKYLEKRYLGRERRSFKDTFSYIPEGKKKPVLHTWDEIFGDSDLTKQLHHYSACDAEGTIRLFNKFRHLMGADGWDYFDTYRKVDVPFTLTLSAVMRRGFLIDVPYMRQLEKEYVARLLRTLHVFRAMVDEPDLNPNSFPQLQKLFFEKLEYPALRATKSGFSVDSATLEAWAKAGLEPAGRLLAFKELDKLRGTFVTNVLLGLEDDGRLYSDLNQIGAAATGRISSRKYEKVIQVEKVNKRTGDVTHHLKKVKVGANLQNIPARSSEGKRIRRAFVAEPGRKLVISDLAGAEWWMMGDRSKDPQILRQYREKIDPHSDTGVFFFKHVLGNMTWQEMKAASKDPKHPRHEECAEYRGKGKNGNFGFIYMCAAPRAAELLELEDGQENGDGEECTAIEHGQWFIDRFYSLYKGIKQYQYKTVKQAREDGFVTTLAWRRRHLPDIYSDDDGTRGWAERAAVNATIQGSIADIIKAAMNYFELGTLWPTVEQKFRRELRDKQEHLVRKLDARLQLQVHDECIWSVPEENADEVKTIVEETMAKPYAEIMDIKLSAEAKVASSWAEK